MPQIHIDLCEWEYKDGTDIDAGRFQFPKRGDYTDIYYYVTIMSFIY